MSKNIHANYVAGVTPKHFAFDSWANTKDQLVKSDSHSSKNLPSIKIYEQLKNIGIQEDWVKQGEDFLCDSHLLFCGIRNAFPSAQNDSSLRGTWGPSDNREH